MDNFYISNITAWAPGLADDIEAWKEWSAGSKQIEQVKESPKLEYADPLFKRRLSQITKMTIEVVHKLFEATRLDSETKLVFTSLRGEIEREFTINKGLIEDGMILPAGFSLSVFNTPISSATLACGLRGGYSVIYPSKNNFADAFKTAIAPVLAGTEEQIVLVYADEIVPEVYGDKRPAENIPLAFACVVSAKVNDSSPVNGCLPVNARSLSVEDLENIPSSPSQFLKGLWQN